MIAPICVTATLSTSPGGAGLARRAGIALAALLLLGGCGEGAGFEMPGFLQSSGTTASEAGSARETRLVERDVEAPDVFQVTEPGLWDGRPSLGGVWVAHPDVRDPERVIIRNADTGSFVIGALFRKERATPGPRLQVSSDAADALGMVAGQPAPLNVTALRRAEDPDPATTGPAQPTVLEDGQADRAGPGDMPSDAPGDASEAPVSTADRAGPAAASTAALDASVAATPLATSPSAAALERPFIQIGIFSVERNATNTAATMRDLGLAPSVKPGRSADKAFWRVIVGPATTLAERAEMLDKIRTAGFADAYAVTN